MLKRVSILLLMSIGAAQAEGITVVAVPTNVVLHQGDKAPFDGILLTPDNAKALDDMKIDLETQKKVNGLQREDNEFYAQRLTLYKTETESLSKQLTEQRDSSIYSKIGFFILGAGITGLLGYGIYKSK